MAMALNSVRSKQLTQRQAALIYGIPMKTLGDRLQGVIADDAQPGCIPTIPVVAEQEIVNATLAASEMGFSAVTQNWPFVY